ncbi:DUF2285 domain-containing protein [Bradyrhizobium ivorense]|uniref:DUF2285 domain-containing protein n=1 Tax=Bradyrhizobium ivorense TaxID=2511166 RepID=UPI001116886A|nr:DUF2285 domain-containing protein [Bradyrhizobium ivorense]
MTSDGSGGFRFAADPQTSFDKQAIFWAPEALSTVLPVHPAIGLTSSKRYDLDLAKLTGSEFRQAPDGWHAVVPLGGAKHRLWLRELPSSGSVIAVDLPLDRDFDVRLRAAQRFWRALEQRPLGPSPRALPIQTRHRLILALRAADGWLEGNSYREIAAGLFGARRIPDRGWKTSDVRSRIIRLVKKGLRLIRGGYRALLRHKRKGKYDKS